MICYAYCCNAILAHPIKNRLANELLQAYQHFYTIHDNAGLLPHMHKMDDKTSADIKHFISTKNAAVQYVSLDNHHTNAAEWSIFEKSFHLRPCQPANKLLPQCWPPEISTHANSLLGYGNMPDDQLPLFLLLMIL